MLARTTGLFAYLASAFAIGAVLAVPIFRLLQPLTAPDFDSVLRRTILVTAIALLPFFLKRAGAGRNELGLGCTRRTFLRSFATGFVLGSIVVLPLLAAFLVLGIRTPTFAGIAWSALAIDIAAVLTAAVMVGLFEEAYFRGALLGLLQPGAAWLVLSLLTLVYAAVHFVGSPVPSNEVDWHSGFTSIARSDIRLDAFLALLGAGLLLGAMRYGSGHIGLGAGFHAGWVWLARLNGDYTDVDPSSELVFLAGSYGGTMGYLGLAWIAVLGGLFGPTLYRAYVRRSPRRAA